MLHQRKLRLALTLLAAASTLSWAADQITIAVIDFEARGIAPHEAAIIAERVRGNLVKSGLYKVMERGQMEAVLQEQGFQNSGACTDASCVVEMGQLLAVKKILNGSVGKIGSMYTVDIKVIDIKTGQITLTHSEDVKGSVESVLLEAVPRITERLTKEATSAANTGSYLSVESSPAGASVTLDGKEIGTTPVKGMEVEAGKHKVVVALEGYVSQERTVTLVKGRNEQMAFTLSATRELLASQQQQSEAKKKTVGKVLRWTGVGIGVAGIGAATAMWLLADSANQDYLEATSTADASASGEDMDAFALYGNISAIAGGVGVVALGVSFAF